MSAHACRDEDSAGFMWRGLFVPRSRCGMRVHYEVRVTQHDGLSSVPMEDMLEHARPWSFYAEGAIK